MRERERDERDGPASTSRVERSDRIRRRWALDVVALAGWAGLILLTHVTGIALVDRAPKTRIFAAPLVARVDPHLDLRVLLPLAVAALAVAFAGRLSTRMGWRPLLFVMFAFAGGWAVSLALSDGLSELTRPLLGPSDYLRDVALVGSPGPFLAHFVQRIATYHQHVRAHPPGMILLLWSMDRIGLRGAPWEATVQIAGGAAMVPAALIALREMAGEPRARAAAPFVAMAPVAVWVATSGDALIAGVSAWAVALTIVSIRRTGLRSDAIALAAGVLFGAGLMFSYGVAVLAVIPTFVAIRDRRLRPLVIAACGAGSVLLAFGAAGFWWPRGLRATVAQYRRSVARLRPQSYFWLGNLGAFAIALGPAAAVALVRLRDRRTWLLVAAGLAAVAVADVSGLAKGEVERIWLPFAPWILVAGSALLSSPGDTTLPDRFDTRGARAWLGLTLATGLAIQILLLTTW